MGKKRRPLGRIELALQPPERGMADPNVPARIVLLASFLIVGLELLAALFPSSVNWGFHSLAFLPTPVKILVLLSLLAVFIPNLREEGIQILEERVRRISGLPTFVKTTMLVALLACTVVLFWQGRERMFLLGDGALRIRSIQFIETTERIPESSSKNEPLSTWIISTIHKVLPKEESSNQEAFQYASIGAGIIFLLLLIVLVRHVVSDPVERFLGIAFVWTSGCIQLFFGYAENYAPVMVGLLLFITLAILNIKGKTHLVFPAAAFGVLFALHLGMAILLQSVGFLFWREIVKKKFVSVVIGMLAMMSTAASLLWMCGYTPALLWGVISDGNGHMLPLLSSSNTATGAYGIFSLYHFLDLANLAMLISPISFIVLPLVVMRIMRKQLSGHHQLIFLLVLAICGMGFVLTVNCELGMSRDWDLFAPFTLGVVVAAMVGCFHFLEETTTRRSILVLIIVILFFQTGSWVAVNASEEYSTARFSMLPDSRAWSKKAIINAYDELAVYYRTQGKYDRARKYFFNYLAIDSTNTRIQASIGEIFLLQGDTLNAVQYFEKAVAQGTTSWEIYYSLASYYVTRDTSRAVALMKTVLKLNPTTAPLWTNYGAMLLRLHSPVNDALDAFLRAIEIDSSCAPAYLNAGICLLRTGDAVRGKEYLFRYLQLEPVGREAERIRHLLSLQQVH